MQTNKIHILILALLASAFAFCSCAEGIAPEAPEDQDFIRIYPIVKNYAGKLVDTKSSMKTNEEMAIYKLDLFIFKNNGDVLLHRDIVPGSICIISRTADLHIPEGGTNPEITSAKIYLLANVYKSFKASDEAGITADDTVIGSLPNLTSQWLPATSSIYTTPPSEGFPMLGHESSFDLNQKEGEVVIELDNLFAKMSFDIMVEPIQASVEQEPTFTFDSYQVFDAVKIIPYNSPAPDAATFAPGSEELQDGSLFESSPEPIRNEGVSGSRVVQRGNPSLKLTFYVPEYKFNSTRSINDIGYPSNFVDSSADPVTIYPQFMRYAQHYKPLYVLSGEHATHVKISGVYTDHQGHSRNVTYTIYLGGNNWNNFHILRNYEYFHKVRIYGAANSEFNWYTDVDESNVSIDHRVDISPSDYHIGIERETLLDSHIEVRPLRINIKDTGEYESADVEILNPGSASWLRMELSNEISPDSDHSPNGKRKYFTTDLVTSTLAGNTRYTGLATQARGWKDCVWFYVDENVTAHTEGYREAQIRVTLHKKNGVGTVEENYTFRQWDLYPVTYNGHTYMIERYEEYLHSYDSQDVYTNPQQDYTQSGIAWGLDGLRLSYDIKAYHVTSYIGFVESALNDFIDEQFGSIAKYDFYNKASETPSGSTYYAYNGQQFTKEIIDEANRNRDGLGKRCPLVDMSSPSESAVQYILAKNKVAIEGSVYRIYLKWYLPAIDEIEDIVMGAYTSFDVFQEKFYWSSQPAYEKSSLIYTKTRGVRNEGRADFFLDNVNYARATQVMYRGNGFIPPYKAAESGQNNATILYRFTREYLWSALVDLGPVSTGLNPEYGEGYMSRNTLNRVRAVYNGTDAPTVTFNMN